MNRRQFTRGLASVGLTPALPMPALGKATTVAAASADKLYFMGWYTARLGKTCSPEVLVSELNCTRDVARQIFAKLVKSNTVSAPNALGISQTIDPLTGSYKRIARKATQHVVSKAAKRPSSIKPTHLEMDAPERTEDDEIDDTTIPAVDADTPEDDDQAGYQSSTGLPSGS